MVRIRERSSVERMRIALTEKSVMLVGILAVMWRIEKGERGERVI